MDFDSLTEDSAQAAPAPTETPQPAPGPAPTPEPAPSAPVMFDELHDDKDVLPGAKFDDLPDDNEKYGSGIEQAKTIAEGAAKGIAGPVATWAETHLLGVNPQDISNRERVNPMEHRLSEAGTFIGSLFTGTGEAAIIGKAAEALSKGVELGKIGSAALKGAIEGGLFQGGDEMSKSMLGQGDPEAPVASALINMGGAGLFGGALGGATGTASSLLSKIGETKMGSRAAQFLADYGSRAKQLLTRGDPVQSATDELTTLHNATTAAADEVHGYTGIKSQAIDKLTENIDPKAVAKHVGEVSDMIDKAPGAIKNESVFQDLVNDWKQKVTPQRDPITLQPTFSPSAADTFKATDQLKRNIQKMARFDQANSTITSGPIKSAAAGLQSKLIGTLEDTKTWGKLGALQSDLNQATSDFIPKLKDFNKTFTTTEEGIPTVNPKNINTYLNQEGKPTAGFKPERLRKFVQSGQDYLNQVSDVYNNAGLESPVQPISLSTVNSMLGEKTAGSNAADMVYHWAQSKSGGSVTGVALGAIEGGKEGYREGGIPGGIGGALTGGAAGYLIPALSSAIGKSLSRYSGPAALKALSTGNALGISQILDHAGEVSGGVQKANRAIEAIFKGTGLQAIEANASDRDKSKVKEFVEKGQMNREIQSQLNAPPKEEMQKFAEGGEVFSDPVDTSPAKPILEGTDSLSRTYPDQSMLMSTAKGRVSGYLNSIRPLPPVGKLPYDEHEEDPQQRRSYESAVNIAANPLSVLHHLKSGTLGPEEMKHFTQMYPEVHRYLSKKITEKISQNQVDEEKPNYKTRQNLSLFLGTPLDSTFTPAAIQAAQAVFQNQKAAAQNTPITKNKKNTSTLGKIAQNHMTSDQARAERQTRPE